MIESSKPIEQLELGTGRRLRLLAAQDLIALSVLVSAGFAVIAFILFKLGLFGALAAEGLGIRGRLLLCGIPLITAGALLALRRVLKNRARWRSSLEKDADRVDLIIDRALGLDDRARTAGSIIRRGGPASIMETAQIEDTASRLADISPERIVEYHPPRLGSAVRCYESVGVSVISALVVLVVMVQYWLPAHGAQKLDAGTIAVMQAAGEDLERGTAEIEAAVKPDTPTAALARQQAELARALRESATPQGGSRARVIGKGQALKELSVIEEKLGGRKVELENTHASEIVGLAERRFQSALSSSANQKHADVAEQSRTGKKDLANRNAGKDKPRSAEDRGLDEKGSAAPKPGSPDKPLVAETQAADKPPGGDNHSAADGQSPKDKPRVTSKSENARAGDDKSLRQDKQQAAGKPGEPDKAPPTDASQAREDGSKESKTPGKNGADQSPQTDSKAGDPQANSLLPGAIDQAKSLASENEAAAEAGKSILPNLSQDLMKKAAEMKANNLTPADIEQFRKAAEGLLKDISAKDLANLANSKEIQQTLEQLARQVDPHQMEQLARQLLSQKEIRDELQAVGKLLAENRQAKETIAGFADKAREIRKQFEQQGYKPGIPPQGSQGPPAGLPQNLSGMGQSHPGASDGPGSGPGSRKSYGRPGASTEALNGQGRSGEASRRSPKTEGVTGSKTDGEPIYGYARPGMAPARVPYSTAYPGYRREAERSVERSQVPPRLRNLIRNYFDAINPDSGTHH
jgi:hypothetical protein